MLYKAGEDNNNSRMIFMGKGTGFKPWEKGFKLWEEGFNPWEEGFKLGRKGAKRVQNLRGWVQTSGERI